jgi:hypothetical protein
MAALPAFRHELTAHTELGHSSRVTKRRGWPGAELSAKGCGCSCKSGRADVLFRCRAMILGTQGEQLEREWPRGQPIGSAPVKSDERSPEGNLIGRFGDTPAGTELGKFLGLHGLAVDSRGRVAISMSVKFPGRPGLRATPGNHTQPTCARTIRREPRRRRTANGMRADRSRPPEKVEPSPGSDSTRQP